MNFRLILKSAVALSVCCGTSVLAKANEAAHSVWVLNGREGPHQPLMVSTPTPKHTAPAAGATGAGHYEWHSVHQGGPRDIVVDHQIWVPNEPNR